MSRLRVSLGKIQRSVKLSLLPGHLKRRLTLRELQDAGLTRNLTYFYTLYFFENHLPQIFRDHRKYFREEQRGFGEDAFHAMWFLLFESLQPKSALEIGVYRGQTISLWQLLSRHFRFDCDIGCVSPFQSVGDRVSQYSEKVDYYADVVKNHEHFSLNIPSVCKAYSTSPEACDYIKSKRWDIIYIDGNHDYEVAKQDWEVCSQSLAPQGLIVLDDSALQTEFSPPLFATKGHEGPSKVADEIDRNTFVELFAVGHNRVFQRKY